MVAAQHPPAFARARIRPVPDSLAGSQGDARMRLGAPIDLEFRMTKMSLKLSFWRLAAKHGPAVGVIPVFNPEYPVASRSLLVFCHW